MDFKVKLQAKMSDVGIELTDLQLEQFEKYYHMLIESNKSMNLTAITEEDEVIDKHFVDSITCNRVMDMTQVTSIIDVGTGGGFPGIPLKIVYPEISFTLLDSLNKRVRFLNQVIEALGLQKIEAIHGRAEDIARDKRYRAQYDLCVSRAVANLSTLSEYCIPFVRVNGYFVSYKAKKGLEEMQNIEHCMEVLGSKVEQVEQFLLPGQEAERIMIKIKKCKGTAKTYPRKAGTPSKNPL